MIWFDGEAAPGWIDYLGLALTVIGFVIAILQLRKTRSAALAAKDAAELSLVQAQRHLSQRSVMFLIPQVQVVVEDLDYSIASNDIQVSRRALVRFAHIASELSALLVEVRDSENPISERLTAAADKATRAKGSLMTQTKPDVASAVKSSAQLINGLSRELTEIAATMRNRVEGIENVQR